MTPTVLSTYERSSRPKIDRWLVALCLPFKPRTKKPNQGCPTLRYTMGASQHRPHFLGVFLSVSGLTIKHVCPQRLTHPRANFRAWHWHRGARAQELNPVDAPWQRCGDKLFGVARKGNEREKPPQPYGQGLWRGSFLVWFERETKGRNHQNGVSPRHTLTSHSGRGNSRIGTWLRVVLEW